jgi:hypothetical protein
MTTTARPPKIKELSLDYLALISKANFVFNRMAYQPSSFVSLVRSRWEPATRKRRKAMFRSIKVLLVVVVVLALAGGAFAFAAANTIDKSSAGYIGENLVSGYNISNIKYNLDSDPENLTSITFNVTPISGTVAATVVKIQTAGTGSENWTDCTLGDATGDDNDIVPVTCIPVDKVLAHVTELNVVSSSSYIPAS